MKLHLVTFGGGHQLYIDAVKRLVNQAQEFKIFTYIFGFTQKELINDEYFWNKHKLFVENNKRGYGYYIWKSYLIKKTMESSLINDGDIILWVDTGCEMNYNEISFKRLNEYVEIAVREGILAFQLDLLEKTYTKMDLMRYVNLSEEDMNTGQIEANILFIKKNEENLRFLDEWITLQETQDYKFVDDTPSIEINDPSFVEHRHDQSCFSVLMKKYKKNVLPQECYWHPNWEKAIHLPIWLCRTRSGNSIINFYKRKSLGVETVAIMIPISSECKNWVKIDDINLLKFTLKTFLETFNSGYDYIFYLGINIDDLFFYNSKIVGELYKYFYELKNIKITLKIFTNNDKIDLMNMYNLLYFNAYNDGCDYFYITSDDTCFTTKFWIRDSINMLKENNNIGVVRPSNLNINGMISKKHMEIFGYLFPSNISNQKYNDWLNVVYGPKYLYRLNDHIIKNLDDETYEKELEIGRQKINITLI